MSQWMNTKLASRISQIAHTIFHFGWILFWIWIIWSIITAITYSWNKRHLVLISAILWCISRLVCRWVFLLINFEVSKRNKKIKSRMELIGTIDSLYDPETEQEWLSFKLLPKLLFKSYDKIIESGFRLYVNTSFSKIRTWYVRSVLTSKWEEVKNVTNALYIEHKFSTDHYINAHILITPDTGKWKLRHISFPIFTIIIIIIALYSQSSDAIHNLWIRNAVFNTQSIFQHNKIVPIVFLLLLLLFLAYMEAVRYKKLISLHEVKVEDKDFEESLNIISDDKVIARQICNPEFIVKYKEWLIKNDLEKNCIIYFDFRGNRLIYKFDYNIIDNSWLLTEEYVKNCIALTNEMIDKISIIRNMAVVYAGRIAIDNVKK